MLFLCVKKNKGYWDVSYMLTKTYISGRFQGYWWYGDVINYDIDLTLVYHNLNTESDILREFIRNNHEGHVSLHLASLPNEFSWYFIFANGTILTMPWKTFVSEIRWRLRIDDAETSSNFGHISLHCISDHHGRNHEFTTSRKYGELAKYSETPPLVTLKYVTRASIH